MHLRVVTALLGVVLAVSIAGCGGHGRPAQPSITETSARSSGGPTLAGGGDERSPAVSAVSPSSITPTEPVPAGVVERSADACPLISTDDAVGAEGNRISSVSELVRGSSVIGCRFRFWCCDFHYTLEISSQRFSDATTA